MWLFKSNPYKNLPIKDVVSRFKQEISYQENLLTGLEIYYRSVPLLHVMSPNMQSRNQAAFNRIKERMQFSIEEAKEIMTLKSDDDDLKSRIEKFHFPPASNSMTKKPLLLYQAYSETMDDPVESLSDAEIEFIVFRATNK